MIRISESKKKTHTIFPANLLNSRLIRTIWLVPVKQLKIEMNLIEAVCTFERFTERLNTILSSFHNFYFDSHTNCHIGYFFLFIDFLPYDFDSSCQMWAKKKNNILNYCVSLFVFTQSMIGVHAHVVVRVERKSHSACRMWWVRVSGAVCVYWGMQSGGYFCNQHIFFGKCQTHGFVWKPFVYISFCVSVSFLSALQPSILISVIKVVFAGTA